mgnify:CR=1 FL=1
MSATKTLKATFSYAAEETQTQINLSILPTGETAKALPDDFSFNAGCPKNIPLEALLKKLTQNIFSHLNDSDKQALNLTYPYEIEFQDINSNNTISFTLDN